MDKSRPVEGSSSPARLAKAPRRVGGSTGGFSKAWAFALAFALVHAGTAAAGTPPGTVISNTGSLIYQAPAGGNVTEQTNTVSITTVAAEETPSSVAFLAYAPGSAVSSSLLAGPTLCSTDGGASFGALSNPSGGGLTLNPANPLPLAPTSMYNQGDALFIELTDLDQNLDPSVRDTVLVTVSVPATHQSVTLKLTETGPNTGVFVGYVPTTSTAATGCALQTGPNTQVQVNYTDAHDSSDKSSATALVDPFDVVFDSTNGTRISGAQLTLVDTTTGKPAQVLGKDGVSSYPSTVTSGSSVTDSSGAVYNVPTGGFLFPVVKAGTYRVTVTTPAGYHAPSVASVTSLEALSGSPYVLPAASFGGNVSQKATGLLQLDIPMDPVSTKLLLQKSVSSPTASVGDVIQFTLNLVNTSTTLAAEGVNILDVMPQGFRYVKGSARLGSAVLADPVTSSTGQQLTFTVGNVPASGSASLVYAVEITAATPLTTVVNDAQAFENGVTASNLATAEVQVQSDFLQDVNTLVGRVVVGCDSQGAQGVEKARVVMEDGSYAITDKHGDYHFQAITNGTHVVQLDLPSLPKGYEPMSCKQDTRRAGRDYSQFVEVHGGALWRADFHVRPIPGAEGDLSLQLSQAPAGDHAHNTVQLAVSDVPVTNLSTTVMLPAGMTYVGGSARLDGQAVADPQDSGDGILVFRLGARAAGWKGVLEFDSLMPTIHEEHAAGTQLRKSFIIQGFPSGKVELNAHDKEVMQQIAALIKDSANISMTFVGYTDNVQLAKGSKYADNIELSIGRAQAVADYVQANIDVDGAQVFITGRGENDPVASNDSEAGRAQNRRTEIDVQYDEKVQAAAAVNTVFQTRALANFDSPASKGQHTPAAAVELRAEPDPASKSQEFTLQDFAPGSSSLSERDQQVMQQIASLMKGATNVSMTFVGYADSSQVQAGSKYADNMELSVARAQAAADYARAHMELGDAQVFITGRGASDAQAATGAGDRRTVIQVAYDQAEPATAMGGGQSDVEHAAVKGLSPADESDAKDAAAADAADDATDDADQQTDKYTLDANWLQTQADGTPGFVFPTEGYLPASPALHVAVEHRPSQKVALFANGVQIPSVSFLSKTQNTKHTAAVSEWLGVPLQDGDNSIVAVISEGDTVVQRIERKVHYSGTPVRAELVPEKSSLVADGRTKPVLAVRFFDQWGYPARRSLMGHFQLNSPYMPYQSEQELQQNQVSALAPREPSYVIGEGGIAYIRIAPTTVTGDLTVTVPLQSGTLQQLHTWMAPAARDWILVGVASGTAAFDKIKNNMQSLQGDDPNSDIYQDGRVAFYAKGTIAGGFLLTTSYDSAKPTGTGANGLQEAVNPNTYFMLYGDASQQGFDAQSASKLYIKIERGQFYAMFGDFDTGLTVTDLSHYDRLFNGVKSAYQGDNFGYTAFAAQNDQAYVKDEIQGNGTSGLYHLSHQQILINSERVTLEVRDRYDNSLISSQSLTQFVDYTIDYFGGSIFFKDPVPANDPNFNPEYIVVEYEVTTGQGNAISAGGRVAFKTADNKVVLGVTGVNEGTGDGDNKLTGADLTVQLTQGTTLKAEVAHTQNGPNGAVSTLSNVNGSSVSSGGTDTSNTSGGAYSLDLKTQSLKLQNDLYIKNEDANFGLGQQSLGDAGMRRLGDNTKYNLDDHWSIIGNVERQQTLLQGSTDDVASAGMQYKLNAGSSVSAGVLHAEDSYPSATPTLLGGTAQGDYTSNQVFANGSYSVLDNKVVLHGNVQTTLGSEAEDPQYPNLVSVGADYKLNPKTTLFVDEQIASGQGQSDRTTSIGVKSQPWDHAEADSSVGEEYTEYGPRLFSTMGLTQGWEVNKNLTLNVGYNRVASMHEPSVPVTSNSTAPAFGTETSNFNSLSLGASYHEKDWAMNGRVETLNSDQQTTRNLFAGFYRSLSEGEAFSSSLQAFHSSYPAAGASDSVDGRLAFAFRPDSSRWSWLEELDLIYQSQAGLEGLPQFASATGTAASQESAETLANNPQTVATYGLDMRNWKVVNNLQGNYSVDGSYQLSLYYGSKWARFAFDTGSYQGYTDLMGTEFRYDIRPKWDLGFMFNREKSYSTGTVQRSYGIESGFDVATNMWLSVGYNFSGFYDQDFTADHYTAKGVYLRFRFKFDQDTVKSFASAGRLAVPAVP